MKLVAALLLLFSALVAVLPQRASAELHSFLQPLEEDDSAGQDEFVSREEFVVVGGTAEAAGDGTTNFRALKMNMKNKMNMMNMNNNNNNKKCARLGKQCKNTGKCVPQIVEFGLLSARNEL